MGEQGPVSSAGVALVGASVGDPLVLALGTGFCGAFTTFSAFVVELVGRFEVGQGRLAAAYGLGMAVTAIITVFVGGWFATVLL